MGGEVKRGGIGLFPIRFCEVKRATREIPLHFARAIKEWERFHDGEMAEISE